MLKKATKKKIDKLAGEIKEQASISIDVDVVTDKSDPEESKSAIDYLKEELKERAEENKDFQASLKAERKRLAAARAAAKERNIFRKIKIVDDAISKKEIEFSLIFIFIFVFF